MTTLVTLDQIKTGLRVEANDDDTLLELLGSAAAEMVIRYLKANAANLIDLEMAAGDSPAGANAPKAVQHAVIVLTGILYRNPDSDPEKMFADNKLPAPVTALLFGLRDPTLV